MPILLCVFLDRQVQRMSFLNKLCGLIVLAGTATFTMGITSIAELFGLKPTAHYKGSIRTRLKQNHERKVVVKPIKAMTFAELFEKKSEILSRNEQVPAHLIIHPSMNKKQKKCRKYALARYIMANKERAIKYVERLIVLCEDLAQKGSLILELADLNFACNHLQEALKGYTEFVSLYPSDDHTEHALYQQLLCTFNETLSYDRDQTKTEEALDIARTFLEREALYTTYADKVKAVQQRCEQKLVQNALYVAQFYLNRGSILAAHKRLEAAKLIAPDQIETVPEIQYTIASLEQQLDKYRIPRTVPTVPAETTPATIVAQAQEPQQKQAVQG
jgi:outer membrane assembly lipoprotein YfiO